MATDSSAKPENALDDPPAVKCGDKLHISQCCGDGVGHGEHFAGEVVGVSGELIRINGHVFIYDVSTGEFHRRAEPSERILRLDNTMIFTVLPSDCDLEALTHEHENGEIVLTDHKSFMLTDTK